MTLRTRTCSLAVGAAFAAFLPLSAAAALPAPSSGTLEIWFKAPVRGATVSGTLQLERCYVAGRGVSRVEFFVDATRVNTDSTMADGMSCVLDTTKFANGTHQLKAVAYDSSGRSYTELTSINIQNTSSGGTTTPPPPSGSGPTVSFKQPASGATLSGVLRDSTLCEVAGSGFNKVVFDLDGRQLNTEMSGPWHCSFDTRSFSNGAHTLKATAFSSTGATTVAQVAVNISNGTTTTPPPPPPASSNGLTFTSPANGATLSGSSNPCAVSVPSGTTYVRFYRDGAWLNTDTSAPHACNVSTTGLASGTHKLKAIAYNTSNAIHGQAEISFNVGTGGSTGGGTTTNQAPTVSITAPTASLLSGTVACAANASDSDGSVSKVEFLVGSTIVATDTAAPYTCSFDASKLPSGGTTFTARATDNLGKATSVSRSVLIASGSTDGGDTGGDGSGTGSAISSADVMGHARADLTFSQQNGYNTQILNQYLNAPSIPETGMHAFALSNGETLRFGKYSDPRNSSRKVLAFQVDPRDVTTSGAKRAELKFGNNLEIGKVYWAAMSVYVQDWGTLSSSDQGLFGLQQHNGSPADLAPNFAIYTSGSGRTFQVHARGSSSSSPSYGNTVTVKYPEQPIPFGRWADFVFKFKLAPSGGGFLQVWMDGTQIVNHQGILGYVTPGYKDFFKFGYYNWSGSNFSSTRKVLMRSPVIVADPTGSKYKPEDLRAYVNAH
jgi:hypothetical protein